MLELHGVRVSYGRIEVVHGVDLSVGQGEAIGMIGPNGAGKSSILRSICGLVRPTAGETVFEGRALNGMAPEQIARLGIALVPEGRHIFKTLTVAENLRLGARNDGDGGAWMERTLERFPILRERAHQRADRLSGGEQQQLAIARALLGRPKLLILDEPSLGLAPKTIDVIYELLQGLRDEGVTMLLVEQNAARTIDFSDRCVVLGTGKVRAQGSRGELQRNPDVLRAYLGRQP
ncbi:MAG TPA: ABC transporter ATP-binding protein [Solirubrobacterales bacterium]|jgi:branched-chain amino acid transport system ATP-binding protein|nr:ABC transporter ATP-binding protein [Solirubrobacterales bacterium]